MKVQLTTTAGVTTALIKTDLTKKMMDVVEKYQKSAKEIRDEDKKLVFGVATDKDESKFDGKLLVLEGKTVSTKLFYREAVKDASKEEVNDLKIKLVKIKNKLEIVEKQVKDAYKKYEEDVTSIKETVINPLEDDEVEGE